jgi:uncharacterized protein (TIGR00369 family)
MEFELRDPDFERRVRESFARQRIMAFMGARMETVGPGYCEIHLPYRQELTQQHNYIHGGVVGTIADSAGGYAGFTLMEANTSVLTVEYKLNLVAPADGQWFIARGNVIRSGKNLVISSADVFAVRNGEEHLCATMLQTLMTMRGKPEAMM